MKGKILLLCVVCWFCGLEGLYAQALKLSDQVDGFGEEVAQMLSATGKPDARANGTLFLTAWTGGNINPSQQKEIVALSQKMLDKRYKAYPQFSSFFGSIALAANSGLIPAEMDKLISTTATVVEKEKTQQLTLFLETVERVFRNRELYQSNFSSLFARGGTISFEYMEAEPVPAAGEGLWGNTDEAAEEQEKDHFSDWDIPATEDDSWSNDWESWDAEEEEGEKDQGVEESKIPVMEAILPPLEGAVIHFKEVDLQIISKSDSVSLHNTSGSFMPISQLFVGEGGTVNWGNTGLDPEKVYAEFKKYSLLVSKPELSAENVKLTYVGKLSEPVEGVFEFKNSRFNTPNDAKYPRFKSYESNIEVQNIGGENLLYRGGFALMGNKIYSSSVFSGMASIEVQEGGKQQFIIKSKQFNLQDTLIQSDLSAVVIFHGQDSIYHPAVRSRFNTQTNVLTLLKDAGSFKNTPFVSSYFKMDITADVLRWNVKSDSMDISILSGKNQVPALFESQEYFNQNRFHQLKSLYEYHPLQMVIGYARKKNSGEFYVEDMARQLGQDLKTLRGAMKHLMQNGYIDYDVQTDKLKVNRKGYHYVLSSNHRKDFDDLLIPSLEPSLPNATFFLNKQELKVRGIKKFYISRSKDVYIQPTNDEITLLQNRDFTFDGQVHAGSFIFLGKEMRFDYDSFLVDLPIIDSIKFEVNNHKVTMRLAPEQVNNQLVETSGVLNVDLPHNKSSRRDFPEYPVFNSFSGSTVYFDRKEIAEGSYSKNIHFTIPPFDIDSLSSSDPATISFPGTFSSAGIVPDFDDVLKVLDDRSLGFTHLIPQDGYKLYNGSGTLYDTLTVDGKGMHSTGRIDYLSSSLYSKEFMFYEDSVLTSGYKMDMKQGEVENAHFPVAMVDAYNMRWYPKQDSMHLENKAGPFRLFEDVATLGGSLLLSSKGLYGAGSLHTKGADVESEHFTFNQRDFVAENAAFTIQSSSVQKPILSAEDVRIAYDLEKGSAEISPEVEGVAALDFPYAQYKTSIPKATWNFEEKTVSMSKPREFDISKSYFYTTRKDLDSLAFNAENALYDIEAQTLNVSGIPYIKVADAKITPANSEVLILENARLQDLENASIVIDTLNEYHQLTDGNIKIHSRNRFSGNATYRLVNSLSDTFSIDFDSFKLVEEVEGRRKKALRTVSSGSVKAEDLMVISPGMLYRGKVTMYADKPALELDGFVKLDLKNIPDYDTWISYKSTGDQREVAFNFESSVTENGKPLVSGVYYDAKTNELYPTFVTKKRAESDPSLFVPAGMLTYDAANNEYRIEEEAKKKGKSYSGRIFAYNENSREVRFEGPLNILGESNKGVKINGAGLGKGSFQSSEFDMNAMLVFDFDLPASAELAMGEDVLGVVQRMGLPQANADRSGILYRVAEIVGEDAARAYEERSLTNYLPLLEAGPELVKSLTFSGVKLKWSADKKSWYSNGKIGLSNIGLSDANAMVDGFVEIRRSFDAGNIVNIFLQASPGIWYYFSYEGNRLLTFSSYDAYNEEINSKSKAGKAKPGEYVIALSDIAETLKFINRFRLDYYGIDTPYELNVSQQQQQIPAATEDDPFSTSGTPKPKEKDTSDDDKDGF